MGDTSHATAQGVFFTIFLANRKAWGVRPFTGQPIQISPTHFRVADVCVLRLGNPPGGIIQTLPLVCIEILSHVQSLSDLQEHVHDYLAMGVENVWIIDPVRRQAWYATTNGPVKVSDHELSVPETPIKIALADIYEQLDEMAAGR